MSKQLIESGVVHFRVGEELGLRLMEIAIEHLTERNNPVQALKTITDSLTGCPTELALQILKGDLVLIVDVEDQSVLPMKRTEIHDKIFPKVDPYYWIEKRKIDIEKHGENLIAGFKELQKEIRINKRFVTITLSYDEIFRFVSGKNENVLDILRDNMEIDGIASLFETTKKYIEFSMSIISTMDWMLKTFNEFSKVKNYAVYNGMKADCSQMLTEVMFVMKETLNFEFSLDAPADNVQTYIDAAMEIDEVLSEGIKPVDIMENWTAGWLSPDGIYYALNGEIANMLHNQIAIALQEKGIIPENEINPDQWLEEHGWVKIHKNNVQFSGCNNFRLSKPNVDMTNVQIEKIFKYIHELHGDIIKLGWRLDPVSALSFKQLSNDLPIMYKRYFEF